MSKKVSIILLTIPIITIIAVSILLVAGVIHNYSPATCTVPMTCKWCGQTVGEPLKHDWNAATCTSSSICKRCGTTTGEKIDHNWCAATCLAPKTCKVCGITSGYALAHEYRNATCSTPKTCKNCGKTSGSKLEHSYVSATCTSPKKCVLCNATVGSALGHNWSNASCLSPKTCLRCYETTGSLAAHQYSTATCTKAATCVYCGTTNGSKKPHSYYAGKCENCGNKDNDFLVFDKEHTEVSYKILGIPQSTVLITNLTFDVSGSDIYVYLTIKKTFDILGKNNHDKCYFCWTLYTDTGSVVKSGQCQTIELRKGDITEGSLKIQNVNMGGNYKLKFFPYELLD